MGITNGHLVKLNAAHQDGIYIQYCKLNQLPMADEAMEPRGEPTTSTVLNQY